MSHQSDSSLPERWPARLLFVAMVAFVLFMALTPTPPPQFHTNWDKLNHAMAFFALMATACYAYAHANNRRRALIALLLLLLGGLIEIGQLFVPGRGSEWFDVAADLVGIAVGWAAIVMLRWTQAKLGFAQNR